MLFNSTHAFGNIVSDLSQDEILNTPEYFAISREGILNDKRCPEHLKKVLAEMPWKDRRSCVQVKPQDWRWGRPDVLGCHWHVDVNVQLHDGKNRTADHWNDWRLFLVSFGGVAGTDFINVQTDVDVDENQIGQFTKALATVQPAMSYMRAPDHHVMEYTSRDIHRLSPIVNRKAARLLIVAFESDQDLADGVVMPSIRDRET